MQKSHNFAKVAQFLRDAIAISAMTYGDGNYSILSPFYFAQSAPMRLRDAGIARKPIE
jgi:hypothetical protein